MYIRSSASQKATVILHQRLGNKKVPKKRKIAKKAGPRKGSIQKLKKVRKKDGAWVIYLVGKWRKKKIEQEKRRGKFAFGYEVPRFRQALKEARELFLRFAMVLSQVKIMRQLCGRTSTKNINFAQR